MIRRGLAILAAVVLAALPARAVEVQEVVSPGGITAWLVEDHANPIVSLDLSFRGGTALDPKGKEGLANMVSGLLDEGAGELDSQAFQQALEARAIRMRFNARLDEFTGSLMTLTEHRDKAFELLALALAEPRFDPQPVERVRSQILASLARQREDPQYIVRRQWWEQTFPDHPYSRPSDGTPETVEAIARDDLAEFARTRLVREGLYIGVVGDITPEALGKLLDRTFGDLAAKGVTGADVPDVDPEMPGDTTVIRRDIPQSVMVFGQPGLPRDHEDFYAAYVLNYLIGGGSFSSRLYQEVREERGLAYSVYTYLAPLDHAALWMGGVATQNARAGETVAVIREQWSEFARDGVAEKRLDDAKRYLTGSFPLRFDSSSSISGMLVGMQVEDLGIDYLDRRNDLVEAVMLEDVRRVAREVLDPSKLTFMVIGDPAGIEGR